MARRPKKLTGGEPPEATPEIDALAGFPHPRMSEQLFGHAAIEASFAGDWANGATHHALLLTGPEGVGKATLAYRIARFALAEERERATDLLGTPGLEIELESRTALQVKALSHPGLLVVRRIYDVKTKRFPTQISVEAVRRLRSFLTLSADGASWRVVIVDQADEMTISAANALLKSLEEPPARCLFLLISCEPGRLLATIHSRCRRLTLEPLAQEPLRQAVDQARAAGDHPPIPDADWTRTTALAAGSPRRALQLLGSGGLDLYGELEALVASLPNLDRTRMMALAERLAPNQREAEYQMFFALLGQLVATAVRRAQVALGNDPASRAGDEGAGTGTGTGTGVAHLARLMDAPQKVARWALLWETLQREKAEAETLNLDRKSLIVGCLLRLEAAS